MAARAMGASVGGFHMTTANATKPKLSLPGFKRPVLTVVPSTTTPAASSTTTPATPAPPAAKDPNRFAPEIAGLRAILHPWKTARHRRALHTRHFLTTRFSKCIQPAGEPKLPLKVGIGRDILAAYAVIDSGSRNRLNDALRDYCGGASYLRAMVAGAVRVDLDGNACGEVSEEAARLAAKQLAKLEARKARLNELEGL